MKLQPDRPDVQTVTAHGPGWVAVNGERIERSLKAGLQVTQLVVDVNAKALEGTGSWVLTLFPRRVGNLEHVGQVGVHPVNTAPTRRRGCSGGKP